MSGSNWVPQTARDFVAGILVGECFAIGAIRSHRIEGIDQSENPRRQQNLAHP